MTDRVRKDPLTGLEIEFVPADGEPLPGGIGPASSNRVPQELAEVYDYAVETGRLEAAAWISARTTDAIPNRIEPPDADERAWMDAPAGPVDATRNDVSATAEDDAAQARSGTSNHPVTPATGEDRESGAAKPAALHTTRNREAAVKALEMLPWRMPHDLESTGGTLISRNEAIAAVKKALDA